MTTRSLYPRSVQSTLQSLGGSSRGSASSTETQKRNWGSGAAKTWSGHARRGFHVTRICSRSKSEIPRRDSVAEPALSRACNAKFKHAKGSLMRLIPFTQHEPGSERASTSLHRQFESQTFPQRRGSSGDQRYHEGAGSRKTVDRWMRSGLLRERTT